MMKDERSNLSKLTIVMTTYRRQDYALRNMHYWSNTEVILLVLDGSEQPIEKNLLESFGNNIIYRHDPVPANNRIEGAFSFINTKYAVLIADDEFYIPSAVTSCIKELDQDDTIIACSGCCLGFRVDKKADKIYGFIAYEQLINYNETMHHNSVKRLNGHMTNYVPSLIYGITRSEVWKNAYKLIAKKKFDFYAADEVQIEMYVSFAGKSKILKELMWLRSTGENLPIRVEHLDQAEPELLIREWWDFDKKQRMEFIKIMSDAFRNTNPNINLNYDEIVISAYNSHIQRSKNLKISKYRIFTNCIKYLIPNKLKHFIIKYLKLRNVRKFSFLDAASLIKNYGVKVDYEELIKIKKIIEKFHKK